MPHPNYPNRNPAAYSGPPANFDDDDALATIIQQPGEPINGYITPDDMDMLIRYLLSKGAKEEILTAIFGQPQVELFVRTQPYAQDTLVRWNDRTWIATEDIGANREPGADPAWRAVSLADMPDIRWPPAPDWNNVQPYQRGELAWYQDQLYRAMQAIPSGTKPPRPTEAAQPAETFTGYYWRHTTTGSTTGFQIRDAGSLGSTLDHNRFRPGDRMVFYWTDPNGVVWGDAYTLVPPIGATNTAGLVQAVTGIKTAAPGSAGTIQQGALAANPGFNDNNISPIIEQYQIRVFHQGQAIGPAADPTQDTTRWTLVSGGGGGAGVVEFMDADAYSAGDLVWFDEGLWFALVDRAAQGDAPDDLGQTTWQKVERPQVHHAISTTPLLQPIVKSDDYYIDTDHPAIGWLSNDVDPNDDTTRLFTAGPFNPGGVPGSDGGTPPQALEDALLQAADAAGRLAALRADPAYGDAAMAGATQPAHRANQYVVIAGETWRWDGTTWVNGPAVAIGGLLRHPVFTETMIRRWISEAQRFQGTIQEDVVPPAVPVIGSTQIKDMMIPEAANQGQYYIAIHDITGAQIVRTADLNHVPPIVDGTYTLPDLTAGDWLMSTGNPNDATGGWARVPGGVLTISIADTLYVERTDTNLLVPATNNRDWLLASRPGAAPVWIQPTIHDQVMGAVVKTLSGLTGELEWASLVQIPDGSGGDDGGVRRPAEWPFGHDPQRPGNDEEDAGIYALPDVGQTGAGNPMPTDYAATNLYISQYDEDGALGGGKFVPDTVHHGGILRLVQGNLWADYEVEGKRDLPTQPGWTNFGGGATDFIVRLIATSPGGHPDMRYGGGGTRGADIQIYYKFYAQGSWTSLRPGALYVVADEFQVPPGVPGIGGEHAVPGNLIRALDTDGDKTVDRLELLAAPASDVSVFFATDATETPSAPGTIVLPNPIPKGSFFVNGFRHEIWCHDGHQWQRVGHPQELPSWTIADAGKVLKLDPDSGEVVWGAGGGHTVHVQDAAGETPLTLGASNPLGPVGTGSQYRPFQNAPGGNGEVGIYDVGGQLRIEFWPRAHDNTTDPTAALLALPAGTGIRLTSILVNNDHSDGTYITTGPFQVDTALGRHSVVWAPVTTVKAVTNWGANYHSANILESLAGNDGDELVNTVDHRSWVYGDSRWVERVSPKTAFTVADEAGRLGLTDVPDGSLVVQLDTGWTWRYQKSLENDPFYSPWRVFSDYVGANTNGDRDALAPHLHIGTLVSVGPIMYQYQTNPDTTAGQPPGVFIPFGDHVHVTSPAEAQTVWLDRGMIKLGIKGTTDSAEVDHALTRHPWDIQITGQARSNADLYLLFHTGNVTSSNADAPIVTRNSKTAIGPWRVKAGAPFSIEIRGVAVGYGIWEIEFTGTDQAGNRVFDNQIVQHNDSNSRVPAVGVEASTGNVYINRARFQMTREA